MRVSSSARRSLPKKPRVSSTSYAVFIALISDEMPPVAAHSAMTAPMLRSAGRAWPRTVSSWGAICAATSAGRLSPMAARISSVGSPSPVHWATNAASAARKIPNGKTANRNRYARPRGELGHLVVHDLLDDLLREVEEPRHLHAVDESARRGRAQRFGRRARVAGSLQACRTCPMLRPCSTGSRPTPPAPSSGSSRRSRSSAMGIAVWVQLDKRTRANGGGRCSPARRSRWGSRCSSCR